MTNQKTVVAIVALAAFVAMVPSLTQDAEAAMYVNPNYPQIGFDQVVYFTYDIEDVYDTVTYVDPCNERFYVSAGTYVNTNQEFISWTVQDNLNGMCGISEYSSYTNFDLVGVDYVMTGPSGTVSGSSYDNQDSALFGSAYGNSGTVHVTLTAHYNWAPTPA